jgi:NAD(P)-dependent dehydrogenase (short-subunit alcohol dehydrogenase family)
MRLLGRSGIVAGAGSPAGAAVARALAAAGVRLVLLSADGARAEALAAETGAQAAGAGADPAGLGPFDLVVEATPLPGLPGGLDTEPGTACAEAAGRVAWLARAAARLPRGGTALLVSVLPERASAWDGPLLALRAEALAALARDLAPKGVRACGIAARLGSAPAALPAFLKRPAKAPETVGAALPGFLRRPAPGKSETAGEGGLRPEAVAEAALWLLSAPAAPGLVLSLGELRRA